jgi:hypothetical protein
MRLTVQYILNEVKTLSPLIGINRLKTIKSFVVFISMPLIFLLFLLPTKANAGIARSELSNFSFQITGGTPVFIPGQSKAFAGGELIGIFDSESIDPMPSNGDFILGIDITNSNMHAKSTGLSNTSTPEFHFSSELTGLGTGSTGTSAYYVMDLKAGTTISLTADATVFADPTYRDTYRIGAAFTLFDNHANYLLDEVYNFGNNPFYQSRQFSFNYLASVDSRVYISAQTYIYNYGTVPEPGTYALLILGFGVANLFLQYRRSSSKC